MKHYAKIISFANHKGGVGKTTTTASMGSILASKGYKVLLVDLDAQANLTSSLLKKEVTTTIYDGLKSQSSTSLYIYKVREDIRLDMIPADLNLAQADLELAGKMARERILSELLENYKSEYDYILIDCPPSLGLLTLNALTASDYVIIPLVAEVLPFNGLKMIFDFINQIKEVPQSKGKHLRYCHHSMGRNEAQQEHRGRFEKAVGRFSVHDKDSQECHHRPGTIGGNEHR